MAQSSRSDATEKTSSNEIGGVLPVNTAGDISLATKVTPFLADESPLMTVREMAAFLKVAPGTVYKMVEHKALPVIRLGTKGRSLRFRRADILKWLEASGGGQQR